MRYFFTPYIISIFLSIMIFVVYIYINESELDVETTTVLSKYYTFKNNYQWPVIGYNRVSSYFGNRQAPTAGASTYHSGIDVAAPAGSTLVSCISGKVTHTGFKGAGGHTIIISNSNTEIAYCHVDSRYYPNIGDIVLKGQMIGKVGPKNVYDVDNNPYKDKNGNPTNGATTGPHLHFSIKVNGEFVNPLEYISE